MSESLDEIAELLLDEAARLGATSADVVVAEGDSLSVGTRLGEVEKVQRSRAKHLGLRTFVDHRSAITSTADFSSGALRALAADSVALARVTASDEYSGLPAAADLARAFPELRLYDPSTREVSAETAAEWCKAAEAAALESDPRIKNSEGAEFGSGAHRIVYAASNGFRGSYRASSCSLSAVPVAVDNGSMERDHWYSARHFLAELEAPEQIGRRAAQRALRRLGARQIATGAYPVIFDPDMAATLLGHLASAVSGYSLYKGVSFLRDKLGASIAPAFVTVVDDGTLPEGLASKPFDAEGLATRRTPVIEGGVLRNFLFDTYSARKLDSSSTGNAARSVADSPHVSPTNLHLLPGEQSPEQLIAAVPAGLYVTELMGFGVNPVTGDYSRGASGLWIENGELSYAVSEITIAGNLLQMFRDIEAVGSDLEMRRSICAPTLKIAKMTVAGR